jgi:phosphohistidine phosphatase
MLKASGLIPDLVISSDAVRARATADAAADAAGYDGEVVPDRQLYLASPRDILAVLRGARLHDADIVMIVGHNPGLEELVLHLTAKPEPMPTAALAQIELPIVGWQELTMSTRGRLVDVWRPRERA